MQQIPNQFRAEALARELVAKTQNLKELNEEITLLKLEIFDSARGGINVVGGRVAFIDESVAIRFDKEQLKTQLMSQLNLAEGDADAFIQSCQSTTNRAPYIAVYLD